MGYVRLCGRGLPDDDRTDRKPLGLQRIHRHFVQTRSRAPSRSPPVHDDLAPVRDFCTQPGACGHDDQLDVRTRQRRNDPVSLLVDHAPGTPLVPQKRRGTNPAANHSYHGSRPGGFDRLYVYRHFLVFRSRRRSLCPLVDVYGTRLLGDPQVGKCRGRTACEPLADPDRLPHGTRDRRTPAQPADHPCDRLYLLFQEISANHQMGNRESAGRIGSHSDRSAVHHYPRHH